MTEYYSAYLYIYFYDIIFIRSFILFPLLFPHISVLEKTEETAASDSEPGPQESSSKVLSSSPIIEDVCPSERWQSEESSVQLENRTCDKQSASALNCDVLNSEDTTGTSEDHCKAELSPILESDSVCRTVQEETNVNPVYL